jgi:NAD(P)-dependent dehydrogenase (short-subunit alcohol dehydrogenase family)
MSSPADSHQALYHDMSLAMCSLACGRLYPTLHPPPVDLTGKVAIVTGGNSGIGCQIATELARQKATVYLACRNSAKAEEAISQIASAVPDCADRIKILSLDTSSLSSVRKCAETWKSGGLNIDILVHNAGIGSTPPGQPFTSDGFPVIYATNLLGSFALTQQLEPHLSNDARVIFTSSTGQYSGVFTPDFSLEAVRNQLEPGFHAPRAAVKANGVAADSAMYSNTKHMQVTFAKLLQNRWDAAAKEKGIVNNRIAHAFSPGFTMTPIFGKITSSAILKDPIYWFLKTSTVLATDVSQGAATAVWLATTDDEAVTGQGMGGKFWERMTRRVTGVDLMSPEKLARFWNRWESDAGTKW